MSSGVNTINDAETKDINMRLDAACKLFLSDKFILAEILKECVPEYRSFEREEIVPFIEGDIIVSASGIAGAGDSIKGRRTDSQSISDGQIAYDILFDALLPDNIGQKYKLIINVEAQNDMTPGYEPVSRAIYYCARLISDQKHVEFSGSEYEKIQKVYSIWLFLSPALKCRDTIVLYGITPRILYGSSTDSIAAEADYDLISIVTVGLGCRDSKNPMINLLSAVFDDNSSGAEKREKLLEYGFINEDGEEQNRRIIEMCNYSDLIWNKGLEKGLEQGLELGLKENIRTLMETVSFDEAVKLLKLGPEQTEALRKELVPVAVNKKR